MEKERDLIELIKEEVNVYEVEFGADIDSSVEIETEVSSQLKDEGISADVIRKIQDMRKKAGCSPDQVLRLLAETDERGERVIKEYEESIKKTALLNSIEFEELNPEDAASLFLNDTFFRFRLA